MPIARVECLVPEEVATCHVLSSVRHVAKWLAQEEPVTVVDVRQPQLTLGVITAMTIVWSQTSFRVGKESLEVLYHNSRIGQITYKTDKSSLLKD